LRQSQIRELSNASAGQPGILPFWFGEPDLPTPPSVCDLAIAEIRAGNTRYAPTLGLPELRQSVSDYVSRLHKPISTERIAITSSGTSSLMLALQTVLAPGCEAVAITPVWPNLCEMPRILGAKVRSVPLTFSPDGWRLDLDQLMDAITTRTTAVIINSPNNPTGWTLSSKEQQAIVERCRRTGTWIVADDVYERLVFGTTSAPSFLSLTSTEDRIISCNSLSKAWRMTGWRLGWVVLPPQVLNDFGKLIEYNTTCVPPFVQKAGRFALEHGESDLVEMLRHLGEGRALLHRLLSELEGVQAGAPAPGGMYGFFRIEGYEDAFSLCKDLIAHVGLGLAPGSGFGEGGDGFVRWCFASSSDRIIDGVSRLRTYLANRRG
jgi:aspartate/methionine/tyrosine aminotransferase